MRGSFLILTVWLEPADSKIRLSAVMRGKLNNAPPGYGLLFMISGKTRKTGITEGAPNYIVSYERNRLYIRRFYILLIVAFLLKIPSLFSHLLEDLFNKVHESAIILL